VDRRETIRALLALAADVTTNDIPEPAQFISKGIQQLRLKVLGENANAMGRAVVLCRSGQRPRRRS
jgi:hypothetical protein